MEEGPFVPVIVAVVTVSDELTDGFGFDYVRFPDAETADAIVMAANGSETDGYRLDARVIDVEDWEESEWAARVFSDAERAELRQQHVERVNELIRRSRARAEAEANAPF